MNYTIYADAFFVMNFCMDMMAILCVRWFTGNRKKIWRIVAAAVTGAMYACLILIFPVKSELLRGVLSYGMLSGIMSVMAFGFETKEKFVRNIFLMYLATFISGGMSNFLYFRLKIKNIPCLMLLILLAEIIGIILMRKKKEIDNVCFEVEVVHKTGNIHIRALLDTGNSLREPYFGRPVCIVENKVVEILLGGESIEKQCGYCIIPYHSLGEANGMILGFLVEKMYIGIGEKRIERDNVVIGVYEGKVSADGNYQMIIHPEIIE